VTLKTFFVLYFILLFKLKIQPIKKDKIQKKHTTQKHKTTLVNFSRFLRHSARKRGGLILQRSRAHTAHGAKYYNAKDDKVYTGNKLQSYLNVVFFIY